MICVFHRMFKIRRQINQNKFIHECDEEEEEEIIPVLTEMRRGSKGQMDTDMPWLPVKYSESKDLLIRERIKVASTLK